jgi:catechol 2,3-dioxygenase-like lactoylglutathione lyase family enzyme
MFTYLTLGSNDFSRSISFYDAVMATLGHARCDTSAEDGDEWGDFVGWGIYEDEGRTQTALWICKPFDGAGARPGNGAMIAFTATTRSAVDAFHATAIANGGTSDGTPGLRSQYNADFYAAYVRDPDGNKLAAVHRGR